MSSQGLRLWLALACVLGIFGGCATVPPAPENAKNVAPTHGQRTRRLALEHANGPEEGRRAGAGCRFACRRPRRPRRKALW